MITFKYHILLFSDIIRRHASPKQEIEIIFNDHEGNDFNALFKTINSRYIYPNCHVVLCVLKLNYYLL